MLKFFINVMEQPAVILGLISAIGLIIQKKSGSDVIKGTVKTMLGLLILSAGAGVIVNELSPFSELFAKAFHLTGVVPFDEAVIGALTEKVAVIAQSTSLIMGIGFFVNLLLARITPFKYIFLTGHMMWIMAGSLAFAMYDLHVPQMQAIIFGSLIQGTVLILLPAIAQPIMRKVTGTDDIAYGHLTTLGCVASAYVGKAFGDEKKSSEDLKLPAALSFFKDTAMSISLVMIVIYLVTVIYAGPAMVAKYAGDNDYITFAILKGLGFAAGVLILLQGVRMFLGEIVPAFRGIALKVVPGAKPALDCPVVFSYAPTALMLGFIFSVLGMVTGMVVSGFMGAIVPLPSIIGGFFTGGTSGIFGNAVGGRRGASIAGFVYGLILTIPVALFYPLFNLHGYGVDGIALLVPDAIAVLSIIKGFFTLGVPVVGFGVLVVVVIALSIKFRKKAAAEK